MQFAPFRDQLVQLVPQAQQFQLAFVSSSHQSQSQLQMLQNKNQMQSIEMTLLQAPSINIPMMFFFSKKFHKSLIFKIILHFIWQFFLYVTLNIQGPSLSSLKLSQFKFKNQKVEVCLLKVDKYYDFFEIANLYFSL